MPDTDRALPLIPAPRAWQPGAGTWRPDDLAGVDVLAADGAGTGLAAAATLWLGLPATSADGRPHLRITLREGFAPEGYRLACGPDGVALAAATPAGAFRGLMSLAQLKHNAAGGALPCGVIDDEPRFAWRGLLLDCARHFMPVPVVEQVIDALALHRGNVLHWHLTEDQGWRVEVPGLPGLTETAAWRTGPDGDRAGGFYTTAEMRGIVAYAAARHITVVPEIEMPGHAKAALAAYPELSCTGGPFAVETQWGIHEDIFCAGNDEVFGFLAQVLTHVLDVFPGTYIHIGGDEAPKDRWRECPRCQARMLAEGLADEDALQSWFIGRMESWLAARGRRLVGWDEILDGGLLARSEGATVQSWRGLRGALLAARAGHDAVVSPTSHAYFDYDPGVLDLQQVFGFDPVPAGLEAGLRHHILGGEMNLWTEYVAPTRVPTMLAPRLAAMAEALWTGTDPAGFPTFVDRLRAHAPVWAALGWTPGAAGRPVAVDVALDDAARCLRGRMTELSETLVLDSDRLDVVSRVFAIDGGQFDLERFDVRVVAGDGRRTRRLDKGDLDWMAFTARGGGVVTLDRAYRVAAVPDLRAGDRLQTRAEYEVEFHHGLPTGRLYGAGLATARSEYAVTLPDGYELTWEVLGDADLVARLDYRTEAHDGRTTHLWRLDDLPRPGRRPSYRSDATGQVTVVPHVRGRGAPLPAGTFTAGADWAAVAAAYRERVAERLAVTPEIAALAARLTATCTTDAERIDVLYGHVQETTRYLGLFTGLGGIIPAPAGEVLANGYGDCKGLGTLLIALLRAVGIDAWPVLVRTGHVGPLAAATPNPIQFNHYIVWADDGADGVWLDATLEGCPAGTISPQDAASPVLSLRPGHEGLHEIPFAAWDPGEWRLTVQGRLAGDRNLALDIDLSGTGSGGLRLRAETLRASQDQLASLRAGRLCPDAVPMRVVSGVVDDGGGARDATVHWRLGTASGRPLPASGPLVFLPHELPPLPRGRGHAPPSQSPDRRESWSIGLPAGWTVAADSLALEEEAFTWTRRTWQDGDSLRLERHLVWRRDADPAPEDLDAALERARRAENGYITITRPTGQENR
ncbi:family 20 glycosylhydrolase [bacterium]|nr:family 20 glycosylhydrolase [bacterium]